MRVGVLGAGRIGAFHADTLTHLPDVEELLVADAEPRRARELAQRLPTPDAAARVRAADTVEHVFTADAGVDAVVIAAGTVAHQELIERAARADLPTYCEKPVALDLRGTLAALRRTEDAGVPLQMGFQRRFDAGYLAARQAVCSGKLGAVHTVRALTSDAAPPPAAYVPTSGGLYRDCLIHDFDAIRWVTGRDVESVSAVGANHGADFFRDAGDVDTAAVLLTLDDGALAVATASRYNGAGYDVRMEVAGTADQVGVGMDPQTPLTSVEPSGAEPGRLGAPTRPYAGFLDRFAEAYRAEMAAFVQLVAGQPTPSCPGREALAALLVAEACEISRAQQRTVHLEELTDAARLRE